MKPSKKKPRIRNRPRNKANRVSNVAQPNAANGLLNLTDSEDDMPDLEVDTSVQINSKVTMPENMEVIKTIQRLMREKILKNQQKAMETTPSEEIPNLNAPPVKQKSFKEKGSAKSAFIENLHKKMEEMMVNGKCNGKMANEQRVLNLVTGDSVDDMPDLENETSAQMNAIVSLPENIDVVKAMQSLMRNKILKNQQKVAETETKNDRNVESRRDVKVNAAAATNQKTSKAKEKLKEKSPEKSTFVQNLQKKMEEMMSNGDTNLMENLKKLFDQDPITDVESSDDEEEYVEYIYRPRKYFLVGLCNLCKCDLCKVPQSQLIECSKCHLTYYCSVEHMKNDEEHRPLCSALQQLANSQWDGHIFNKCYDMSPDQFRSHRIIMIRNAEMLLKRLLSATEQEVILFPRLCLNAQCRKFEFNTLKDCSKCGMVAYCSEHEDYLNGNHEKWCKSYQLFKELVMLQEKFGRLDPSLPTKVVKETPLTCNSTKQIFNKLAFDLPDNCEFAALTQISTAPLTAWYALKLSEQLNNQEELTIHLIGAEIEFEVDVLHKWELFFLHITPTLKRLNVVFVGPELNPNNISFEQLQKTKCCTGCRKSNRSVKYYFEAQIYHEYCRSKQFIKPSLVCFFNAGLYRSTGYNMEDTWPETIYAAANLKVPIVVTAYTEYESPLDMFRFEQECGRDLKVIQNPAENPFASIKPERNFISDDEAPLMFKNYYYFVVE